MHVPECSVGEERQTDRPHGRVGCTEGQVRARRSDRLRKLRRASGHKHWLTKGLTQEYIKMPMLQSMAVECHIALTDHVFLFVGISLAKFFTVCFFPTIFVF